MSAHEPSQTSPAGEMDPPSPLTDLVRQSKLHHHNLHNSFTRTPATGVMRRPVVIVTFGVISLFVFFCSNFPLSEHDVTQNIVLQIPTTIESSFESNKKNGVVIVTAASYEKLADFAGVDGFYQKMWDNRMSYAGAHGTRIYD